MVVMVVQDFQKEEHPSCSQAKGLKVKEKLVHEKMEVSLVDRVLDGAFGGVRDEEVVMGEGLEEDALVEFMVEWCEEDEDDDRSEEDDLFNYGGRDQSGKA
ncbi:hypothetical protein Tco_1433986 [Tanacetum coccineum]